MERARVPSVIGSLTPQALGPLPARTPAYVARKEIALLLKFRELGFCSQQPEPPLAGSFSFQCEQARMPGISCLEYSRCWLSLLHTSNLGLGFL